MLKIYHAPMTRGLRVIWLAEELELPYTVERIDFSPAYRSSPQWRAVSPLGKLPVLTDGDLTMFESCAMMDYLLARYGNGRLQPAAGSTEHAHYLQWHWYAEATFARPLGEIVNHGRAFPGEKRIAAVVDEMAGRATAALEAVADHMAERTYLVGETFTAADISMGYTLMLANHFLPDAMPPTLAPYWSRLTERPGYQAAAAA